MHAPDGQDRECGKAVFMHSNLQSTGQMPDLMHYVEDIVLQSLVLQETFPLSTITIDKEMCYKFCLNSHNNKKNHIFFIYYAHLKFVSDLIKDKATNIYARFSKAMCHYACFILYIMVCECCWCNRIFPWSLIHFLGFDQLNIL